MGAVLANRIGTTWASLLLIRPFPRANRGRTSRVPLIVLTLFFPWG